MPHWDIFDPDTQLQVGVIRLSPDPQKGFFRRWWNPVLEAHSVPDDALVWSLYLKISRFWRPPLQVRNSGGDVVGYFKKKWFSLNGGYWVYDGQDQPLGEVRADWTEYEFRLLDRAGEELGRVSRKLVGLHRALLYNERDFLVTLGEGAADNPETKILLLATAVAANAISP